MAPATVAAGNIDDRFLLKCLWMAHLFGSVIVGVPSQSCNSSFFVFFSILVLFNTSIIFWTIIIFSFSGNWQGRYMLSLSLQYSHEWKSLFLKEFSLFKPLYWGTIDIQKLDVHNLVSLEIGIHLWNHFTIYAINIPTTSMSFFLPSLFFLFLRVFYSLSGITAFKTMYGLNVFHNLELFHLSTVEKDLK